MSRLDLVIRGGTVVTAGAVAAADVGIADGVVVQIGGAMAAAQELDAGGMLLFPGGIDAHVHLSNPPGEVAEPAWVDDFASGSAAALAGGVTTLGNMTFLAPGETPLAGLAREAALVREQAIADVFLHPVLGETTAPVLDEIPRLLAEGCNSIKFFMSFPDFDASVAGYLEATRRAGAAELITLIHCEDRALITDATARLVAAGRTSLRHYPESRPVLAELVATQRAIAFAEATGAPVYVVHLSSRRALEACADAQARGIPVFVETRPLYLHLTRERFEEAEGAKYVGQPPLREREDLDALWAAIRQGTLQTVCTDHAPWSLAAKLDPALSVADLRPGVENLQTMLPMLYSEGVRGGRISLSRFVEVTSTNAAKLFGLYPRKGTIAVGGDADIVVFDPELTRTVTASMLESNADYTVYEGWEVTGWPIVTLRRGEVVYRHGEVVGKPGSGRLVRRERTRAL
ncbi:MAG: Dihydropyrimidinase @ D-hydantoinase [uncultured Thermomicrobiales bacterium]|uniref:D-hydantoinase n=1 Tax=uncultured Thermomicrobiales bacterium TaxID=1645740 RepID=A0A6J4VDM8_9BACT|nr:MAG: Dihydropyrimidinase @ D-hydantoinase [uncultured Thermomicrobiales bacterium]